MNVIIVGAGVVGSSLAEQLSQEGHNVAVVDENRARIKELNDTMDVLGVHGNGALPSILRAAGAEEAEMVIAVTSNDEVNLVVGMLAARLGIARRVVRIRNPEYNNSNSVWSLKDLGIDHVVNPEPFIVESLIRMMDMPGSYDYAKLADGQVEMFGFHIAEDSPAIGKTLAVLREVGNLNAFLILYITRNGQVIVPRGDDVIQSGDSVHCLVSPDTVQFVVPIMQPHRDPTSNVIVVGASRIGVELAQALKTKVNHLTLIESDEDRAEQAAVQLRKTTVLHGDPADLNVLEEASVDLCDFFCAVSDDGQMNMLTTLLAAKHGAHHTAVLVHQPEFVFVLDSLGVDIVINPRLVIVGEIMRHVRRGRIHSVTRLAEGRGEILELEAVEGCAVVDTPLRDLRFPKHALVGAVVRDGEMMIPDGDTHIAPGDHVLVYALPDAIPRIEKLFVR